VDRGGEVLAPGTPSDPIQFIDVRDLAEWLALLVENNTTGVFNACGPDRKLGMGELLAACRDAGSATDVRFTWVDHEFLEQQAASGDAELPIWVAPVGDNKGFHTWSFARAAKAGLKFRPVSATVKDTLAWFKSQPAERQAKLKAGPSAAREAEILAAWHKRAGAASRDKQAAGGG
jgi:2'-hydroxyisoflavone reductase